MMIDVLCFIPTKPGNTHFHPIFKRHGGLEVGIARLSSAQILQMSLWCNLSRSYLILAGFLSGRIYSLILYESPWNNTWLRPTPSTVERCKGPSFSKMSTRIPMDVFPYQAPAPNLNGGWMARFTYHYLLPFSLHESATHLIVNTLC
jgi:hypothetical protein